MVEVWVELFEKYARGFLAHKWLVLPAAFYVAACVVPSLRQRLRPSNPKIRWLFSMLALVMGAAFAWSLMWASDDAYISFRYAENLAGGEGLVFNPGERVEGYTDFLWTVIMAGFIRCGVDPGHAGILLSLASFLVLLVLLARLGERWVPEPALPIGPAPLLAAGSYTIASFATGGLETVFAAMLVVLALDRALAGQPLVSGIAGIAATLSHPDHGIFYAALGAALVFEPDRRRVLVRYAAPFFGLFVPYFAWRLAYYGDPFPNTYYAKSAGEAYFEQGWIYVAVTAVGGGLLAISPLAVVGIFRERRTIAGRFAAIGLPVFILYVMKIGGDFMLGRLLTPVLALGFLFADLGFRDLLSRGRVQSAAGLGLLAAVGAMPVRILAPGEIFRGIADERSYTPVTDFSTMTVNAAGYRLGHHLRREIFDKGHDPKVAIYSLGMGAYYSGLPIFDLRGLTNPIVAKLPIVKRGRPGHEKLASPGDIAASGSLLSELAVFPPPYDRSSAFRLRDFHMHFVRYERSLVESLGGATRSIRFPRQIDRMIPALSAGDPDRVACDLWYLEEYYFSVNDDPGRAGSVRQAAVHADPSLAAVAPLLLDPRDLSAMAFKKIAGFSFEPQESTWTSSGGGAGWGRAAVRPLQGLAFRSRGQLLNTFTRRGHERSIGERRSPPFVIRGDVITILVGGTFDPVHVHVGLEIAGASVRTATGCNTDWMGRRRWDVRELRGKTAQIVVKDGSRRGYLLVDEIAEWQAP